MQELKALWERLKDEVWKALDGKDAGLRIVLFVVAAILFAPLVMRLLLWWFMLWF